MSSRSLHAVLIFSLLASGLPATAVDTAAATPAEARAIPDPPMRALWSRSDVRFLRHWTGLGPLAQPLADEANLRPPAGPSAWRPLTSWGDVIYLADMLGAPQYRGASASVETAYAHTTVTRARDGDALLSFGSSVPARIWVNGALVRELSAKRRFTPDEDRLRVQLKHGENSILIATEHTSGPWMLALRVLEPGTVLPPPRVSPAVVRDTDTELAVSTDIPARASSAPVTVSIIGGGGRLIAKATMPRGRDAAFRKTQWPQGAYEIRLETRNAWNEREVVHLDAYNGDARAAAQRLLDAAKGAANDTAGATVRMLADMTLERLGGPLEKAADDGWSRIASPLMEYEEFLLDQAGKTGSVRPWGFTRIAYTDETDGSTQYCRTYLPPDYSAAKPSPLVLFLHGYNPPNPRYVGWWSVAERHNDYADRQNIVYVEPHGRGNTQYIGMGEQDVLHCLAEVKKRLRIDDDRVYLGGESMGGSGAWLIASRHPELFVAVAITHGGWDYRIVPGAGFDNPRATRPLELWTAEAQSSFVGAESLLNVPLLVRHGDQDAGVSTEFSRHAVRLLSRWGYDVRYDEVPGRGHEDLGYREDNIAWLLTHTRAPAPRHVRIRAIDLGGASAYWLQVDSAIEPLQVMRVDAEVVEPGLIRIDSENVAGATLTLPPELRGPGPTQQIVWNGFETGGSLTAEGRITIASMSARPVARGKQRGLEGRLSDLFRTPFAIVIGSRSHDPRMQRYCQEKGAVLAQLWKAWQHEMPRVFQDSEVTPEIEKQYSLFLVGGPDENLVTAGLIGRLPLAVAHDAVTIDGRRFAASDAFVQMIYPSPSAPGRYVLVVAATSTNGMYFWNPAAYWDQVFGYPTTWIDWNIVDGRRVTLERGLGRDSAWIAAGVFDRSWRLDDRSVFTGDDGLRLQSPLRHAPAESLAVPAAMLDAYAGNYQIFPGVIAVITHTGEGLTLIAPGAPPISLVAESETDFATPGTVDPLNFERDASGKVTAFALDYNGTSFHATRLP
ncbi:MAG TPA: PHB depolymerase family esterase [Steroidobacteraceae bacterium]|nr:PHB depolymerase family esterase [Steroidobacteraceae bacterium]